MTPEATNAAEAVRSDWAGSVPPEQVEAMAASVAAAVDAGAIVRPRKPLDGRTFRLCGYGFLCYMAGIIATQSGFPPPAAFWYGVPLVIYGHGARDWPTPWGSN